MATIRKNVGQAGSGLTGERGDGDSLRDVLISIVADLAALRQAAFDIDAAAATGVTVGALVTQVDES